PGARGPGWCPARASWRRGSRCPRSARCRPGSRSAAAARRRPPPSRRAALARAGRGRCWRGCAPRPTAGPGSDCSGRRAAGAVGVGPADPAVARRHAPGRARALEATDDLRRGTGDLDEVAQVRTEGHAVAEVVIALDELAPELPLAGVAHRDERDGCDVAHAP